MHLPDPPSEYVGLGFRVKLKVIRSGVEMKVEGYRIKGSSSSGFNILCWLLQCYSGALELESHRFLVGPGSKDRVFGAYTMLCYLLKTHIVSLSLLHGHLCMDDRLLRSRRKGLGLICRALCQGLRMQNGFKVRNLKPQALNLKL